MAAVLSLKGEGESLKKDFLCAGLTIEQEREHQLNNALSIFPCTSLMRVGRDVLEKWKADSSSLERLVQVHTMLEKDLQSIEERLDGSGRQSKAKDEVVQKLRDSREEYDTAKQALEALSPLIKAKNQKMAKMMWQGFGFQGEPTLDKLRFDARRTLKELNKQTFQLTGEIQHHFPEVILFVGHGLPPDLGLLWRPSQSLDSFDEKELVQSESRHKVWKVRMDNEWFAIKEYSCARGASDLRTCLKEATVICKQRHHAIVEITALFQGTNSETFYMQMPWYTNGALDQWVCGNQRPTWSQVRSVRKSTEPD